MASDGTKSRDYKLSGCCALCTPAASAAAADLLFRAQPQPAIAYLRNLRLSAAPHVSRFADDLVIYVVSQNMNDLLSIYLLHLHPTPYCGRGPGSRACSPVASPALQGAYAIGLLPVAALAQAMANRSSRPSLRAIPQICGMLVGWATGGACVAALRIADASCEHCGRNVIFTTVATVAVAVVLVLIVPLTLPSGQGSSLAHCISSWAQSLWKLCDRALAVAIFMMWNETLVRLVTAGVEADSELYGRLLTFWAFTLHGISSLLTLLLLGWRQRLESLACFPSDVAPLGAADAAATDADAVPEMSDALPPAAAPTAGVGVSMMPTVAIDSDTPDLADSLERWATRSELRRHALVKWLELMESTMGWVTGCAWTNALDAVVRSLIHWPTWQTLLENLGVALGVTLFTIIWLTFARGHAQQLGKHDGRIRRHEVEAYFLSNALAFVGGWTWVVQVRDLATMLARSREEEWWHLYGGPAIVMLLFGPVFTVLFLWLKESSLRAYKRVGDESSAAADGDGGSVGVNDPDRLHVSEATGIKE